MNGVVTLRERTHIATHKMWIQFTKFRYVLTFNLLIDLCWEVGVLSSYVLDVRICNRTDHRSNFCTHVLCRENKCFVCESLLWCSLLYFDETRWIINRIWRPPFTEMKKNHAWLLRMASSSSPMNLFFTPSISTKDSSQDWLMRVCVCVCFWSHLQL